MQDRQNTIAMLRDLHRDATGIRPSASKYALWAECPLEHLDREVEYYSNWADREREREEADQKAAAERFEVMIPTLGAPDRATAIRWLQQAHGAEDDIGYLEYQLGLAYGYLERSA